MKCWSAKAMDRHKGRVEKRKQTDIWSVFVCVCRRGRERKKKEPSYLCMCVHVNVNVSHKLESPSAAEVAAAAAAASTVEWSLVRSFSSQFTGVCRWAVKQLHCSDQYLTECESSNIVWSFVLAIIIIIIHLFIHRCSVFAVDFDAYVYTKYIC